MQCAPDSAPARRQRAGDGGGGQPRAAVPSAQDHALPERPGGGASGGTAGPPLRPDGGPYPPDLRALRAVY